MDNQEAKLILAKALEPFRQSSYEELRGRMGTVYTFQVQGDSGAEYQIEIEAFWDGQPGQAIRVLGSIDDGGWRAFAPLSDSFLKEL